MQLSLLETRYVHVNEQFVRQNLILKSNWSLQNICFFKNQSIAYLCSEISFVFSSQEKTRTWKRDVQHLKKNYEYAINSLTEEMPPFKD